MKVTIKIASPGRKGAIFTADILIGIGLAVILLMAVPMNPDTNFSELSFQALGLQSNDLINVMSTLRVDSFKKTPTIASLISNGTLTSDDFNKTMLDLIGSYWYANNTGNKTIAAKITKDMFANLTTKCYSLQTQNETVYSSCNATSGAATVAFKISSGYDLGKPVNGYISRAWVTKVQKNTTQIIPFYPEGSAWPKNLTNITKRFFLPDNITIYNATLYVSAHFGDSLANSNFKDLMVNGVQLKSNISWLYNQTDTNPTTSARYGVVDVTRQLAAGNNTVNMSIGASGYHSHLHPGMRLIVTYSLTQDASTSNQTFTKKYYFDNVLGGTGAWSMVSFYLPENATNVSAALNLHINQLKDTKYSNQNATDVKVFVNGGDPFYSDGVTDSCTAVRDTYYCVRTIVNNYTFRKKWDITGSLENGTNVVSVYADCYNDQHWGNKSVILYSDPVNDPSDSSYVEINYSMAKPLFNYGEIDITKEKLFGGQATNPKTYTFTLGGNESRLISAFTHIAQGFSSMIKDHVWSGSDPQTEVYISPSARIVPENVYIYPRLLDVGTNNIELTDFQSGGSTSQNNYILPWSSFEYTYLVRGMVGYGGVFSNSSLAVDDAKLRLVQQIGAEGITAASIAEDSQSIQGIQWLWGPSLFKMVVWNQGT
jgi:hypothetical protein